MNVFWDSMRLYEVKFLYKWLKKGTKGQREIEFVTVEKVHRCKYNVKDQQQARLSPKNGEISSLGK